VPGAKVEVARLDLAELATVRDFAARALDKGFPLDVLINNAGELGCCQPRDPRRSSLPQLLFTRYVTRWLQV
jgi:NAD(P)-dependent dehydrogenase (short-subunit alcohol dehydrogenase family)